MPSFGNAGVPSVSWGSGYANLNPEPQNVKTIFYVGTGHPNGRSSARYLGNGAWMSSGPAVAGGNGHQNFATVRINGHQDPSAADTAYRFPDEFNSQYTPTHTGPVVVSMVLDDDTRDVDLIGYFNATIFGPDDLARVRS